MSSAPLPTSALAAAWPRLRSLGVVAALVVLVAIVAIAQPEFLAPGNLMNVLSQWAPVAVMGVGMTYVVITGGFDLSVGATYALCAVVAAALGQTQAPAVAFTAAMLVGLAVGAVNGLIVTALRVNAFIATLGSSLILGGIALVITGNRPFIVDFPDFGVLGSGRIAGIPYSGLLAIAVMIVGGLVLAYTPYGQSIYAVGGNLEASRLAGIRTSGVVASSYALSGLCAGIAGVISASRLSSAQASMSSDLVFDVLTVVIVGGTLLSGGKGAVWRTAVGVAILATLQNGFNLLDINPYYQDIIKGLIIIAALASVRLPRRIRPAAVRTSDDTAAPAPPTPVPVPATTERGAL